MFNDKKYEKNSTTQRIINQDFEPYIGPRPFRRDPIDQSRFFGRDTEADEIISLIISHRLVLIYAQSGTGKTSIFNGQVIRKLEDDYDFQVLPIARVQVTSVTPKSLRDDRLSKIDNIYINNAIQSLIAEAKETHPQSVLNLSLFEFLDSHFPNNKDPKGELQPQVLIFDQLEELFNLYPDNWIEQRRGFFGQIADSLENNPVLRIVFIIREDYLAQLDPFKAMLPEKLRPSFRLQQLTRNQAILAIKGPLSKVLGNRDRDEMTNMESEINELVNNLLRIKVEDPSGGSREVEGEFVEPIQLQVVCRRWWNEAGKEAITGGKKTLNLALLNVDQALQDFYNEAISNASNKTGIFVGDIRIWCEKKLITSSGTRNLIHREHKMTSGLPNKVLEVLESSYLIRGGWLAGAKWYELTHDRLIKPVTDSNIVWKKNFQSELRHRTKLRKWREISFVTIPIAIAILLIIVSFVAFPNNPSIIGLNYTPYEVISDPWFQKAYVSNSDNDTISVIDSATNTLDADIQVGQHPTSLALDSNTDYLYVANSESGTVSVIDGNTNTLTTDIVVGKHPTGLALAPDYLYVANSESGTVSVVNRTTNTLIKDIQVGQHPTSLAFDNYNNRLYVANSESGTVSVIDPKTDTFIDVIEVGQHPTSLAFDNYNNRLYVANSESGTISVINGTTKTSEIPINSTISDISLNDPYGFELDNLLAVATSVGDVYIYNLNSRENKIDAVPNSPNADLYIYNASSRENVKIDYQFKLGYTPFSIIGSGYDDTLYISNLKERTVSALKFKDPSYPSPNTSQYLTIFIAIALGLIALLLWVSHVTNTSSNLLKR